MGTNIVILLGRLTKDPEIRYTSGDRPVAAASFLLAVERYAKGGNVTDFIRCKAFGKTAETIEKYCGKGKQICLVGEIHTSDYEKDGKKQYMTEVYTKSLELLGKPGAKEKNDEEVMEGFSRLEDDIPFE